MIDKESILLIIAFAFLILFHIITLYLLRISFCNFLTRIMELYKPKFEEIECLISSNL